jgi:hypothetical protein
MRAGMKQVVRKSQEKVEGLEGIKFVWPGEEGEAGGIERELKVVRVGPNPRMVICEYMELAERRVCVVKVGDNRRWLRGMRFKMREPVGEDEYVKPWEYRGKAPRRKGRW